MGWLTSSLAVDPAGQVQLAWLDMHYTGAPSSLREAHGPVGTPLSAPAVLSAGGKGTSSGPQVAAAFAADGGATVAWAKPGSKYEDGGTLEVFTRPAGGTFGPAQTLAEHADGVVLAGGTGSGAVLSWMTAATVSNRPRWTVYAATRPQAGGAFGAATAISRRTSTRSGRRSR